MKQINKENNIIIYSDDNCPYRKIIYGEYSETAEITFIMQDIVDNTTGKHISTEVIGFYYGIPEIDCMEQYVGKLKAEF